MKNLIFRVVCYILGYEPSNYARKQTITINVRAVSTGAVKELKKLQCELDNTIQKIEKLQSQKLVSVNNKTDSK